MKYYIIAGEASGDLHGSSLIKELKQLDHLASFRCWGGDMMEQAGATIVKHYKELAFMGFIEVAKNLSTIFKNISYCKKDILQYQPDVLILIDYPGFNLRMAKWAKQKEIKVIYYISPQVWAWKKNRVKKIKRNVDKMLVILPFERAFYQKWNFDVEYVGHPLVDVIEKYIPAVIDSTGKDIIALLPGSRKQEILKKLPIMLAATKNFTRHQFIVAKSPGVEEDFYNDLLAPYSNVSTVANKTYDLLSVAKAALVTSGTATLETALFGVPEIICYKGSQVSYQIAKQLIKIKYICLVNLIMNREVVKELIQDKLTVENITIELQEILTNPEKYQKLKKDYADLKNILQKGGNASSNAAKSIFNFLNT